MKKINIYILSVVLALITGGCKKDDDVGPDNVGTGGSMASFTISNNHLYIINGTKIQLFDIENAAEPVKQHDIQLRQDDIETLFPYQDKLFVGSQNGMYIYSLADPSYPQRLSIYEHITSCDPVVVQGSYAYVTLRTASECNRGVNMLDVVDISDLSQPRQVASYPMINPHGLGIDNKALFVCEGSHGLKIFNASNPTQLVELTHMKGFDTYDVIPDNNLLIVTGRDGLYQFDYSDINHLKLLSTIPVVATK